MANALKADSDEIASFLEDLQSSSWLGASRSWWPKYVFHFTELSNVVSILNDERLLCRNILKGREGFTDIASSQIIDSTLDQWKKYVRLYFRPRTPTQFANEGFRPINRRRLNSHCPIPVVLLFNAQAILTRTGSQFSEGNLGAGGAVAVGNTADFLRILSFKDIYHDSAIWGVDDARKNKILFHRNAEIIVPE